MARILKPLLVGGSWGVALGCAAATATVLAPGLRSFARRAVENYSAILSRANELATHPERRLHVIYGEKDQG